MKEIVISDATEFICLERYPEGFDFFHILFASILIPTQVADELVDKSRLDHAAYFAQWGLSKLVTIVPVTLNPEIPNLSSWVGKGEAYAISLAWDKKCKLMIEDKKARNFARRCGVMAVRMGFFVVAAYAQQHIKLSEAQAMLFKLYQANMFDVKQYQHYLSQLTQNST